VAPWPEPAAVPRPSRVKSLSYIDIVKGICESNGKLKLSMSARQESLKRALVPIPSPCEKRRMGSLCPDEIVAAVVRRSDHYVVGGQRFERVSRTEARQVWAVAVEGNHALPARTLRSAQTPRSSLPQGLPLSAPRHLYLSCAANRASSFTSESGHMMATSTVVQRPRQRQRVVQKTAIEAR
jgi:hypothetical protein